MSQSTSQEASSSQLFSIDEEEAQNLRREYGKFRILIVGRANAGKTTILQRVCNTTESPVIYDANGEEIDSSILESSRSRGHHDIEDEMVFESNPGFCFHDSRGFESGGVDELNKVKAFIERRSKETKLSDQLHTIWYCIPVDDSRPFTAAEDQFFSECGTGKVPVIVIFTKFDHLDTKAFKDLRKEKQTRQEAREQAPQRAVTSFESMHLETLYKQQHPPKAHIYLRDMNKEGSKCDELIEQTAVALDNETLQLLFVSTQRNDLELCVRYTLEKAALPAIEEESRNKLLKTVVQTVGINPSETVLANESEEMIGKMLRWFPQYGFLFEYQDFQFTTFDRFQYDFDRLQTRRTFRDRRRLRTERFHRDYRSTKEPAAAIYSRLFSQQDDVDPVQRLIRIAITTAILADFGLLLWDDCNVEPLKAIDLYERSTSIHVAVMQAANEAFKALVIDQEENRLQSRDKVQVRNRLQTRESLQAKERLEERKRLKARERLLERMIQITLDNRLPAELLKDPIITGKGGQEN